MGRREPRADAVTGLGAFAKAILRSCWLASVGIIPLYFNPLSARVFEPDKLAWLILLGLLCLCGLLVMWGESKQRMGLIRSWREQPLVVIAVGAALALAIGTALSSLPSVSFWGAYRRGPGLVSQLALISIFAAVVATGAQLALRRRFVDLAAITAVPVSGYAILQRLGIDSLRWDIYGSSAAERAFGSMGNPIFLAAWLAMVVPLSLAGLLSARDAIRRGHHGARGRAFAHGLALTFCLAGLIAAQSRGPVLGLAAGLATFGVLAAVTAGRRDLALATLGLLASGLLLVLGLGRLGLAGMGRFGELLSLGSRTARERMLVWDALGELARANPLRSLIGYGPDHLAYVLPPHLDEALVQLTPDQYFDRAHNLLWEWWVSAGVLGLLAILALYVAAFGTGYRRLGILTGDRGPSRPITLMVIGTALFGLMPVLVGQVSLVAPATLFGLIATALLIAILGASGTESLDRDAGDQRWLDIGLLSLLAAHAIEGALGLPTASGGLYFWLSLGLLAAPTAAKGESQGDAEPGSGIVEGLYVSALLMAPIMLPSLSDSLAAWPLLLLIPATWLTMDLIGADRSDPARRALERLTVALGFLIALSLLRGIAGGEILAFTAVLLGAILAMSLRASGSRSRAFSAGWRGISYLAMLVAATSLAWWLALRPVVADVHARQGQELLATEAAQEARSAFGRAAELWPEQPAYGGLLATALESEMLDRGLATEARIAAFELARAALERSLRQAPDAFVLSRLAGLMQTRAGLSADRSAAMPWLARADALYDEAKQRYPSSPSVLQAQAGLHERLGRSGSAAEGYAKAFRLKPAELDAAAGAMRSYLAQGDVATADTILRDAMASSDDKEALARAMNGGIVLGASQARVDQTRVMLLARYAEVEAAVWLLDDIESRSPAEPATALLRRWLDSFDKP